MKKSKANQKEEYCLRCGQDKEYPAGACSTWGESWKRHLWKKPQSQQLIEGWRDKFYGCWQQVIDDYPSKQYSGLEKDVGGLLLQQHQHSVKLCMEAITKVKGVGSFVPLKDEISRPVALEALQKLLTNNTNE